MQPLICLLGRLRLVGAPVLQLPDEPPAERREHEHSDREAEHDHGDVWPAPDGDRGLGSDAWFGHNGFTWVVQRFGDSAKIEKAARGPVTAREQMHPLFVFHHVPKAGGNSFRAIARELWGGAVYWHGTNSGLPAARVVAANNPEQFRDTALVGGHAPFEQGLYERLGRPVVHLSVMREPVARVLSAYAFIRSREVHRLHAEMRGRTLYEALTQVPRFRDRSYGHQLRVLFGRRPQRKLILSTAPYVIGKLERFDAFVSFVATTLFEKSTPSIPHENSGPKDHIDEIARQPGFAEAVAMLKAENEAEFEFYNSFGDLLVSEPLRRIAKH
jgi:hypothetical protein